MGVIVPQELQDRLRARVAAGEFPSLEEAVSEAVRQFDLTQPPSEELRAAIVEGWRSRCAAKVDPSTSPS